MIMWKGRLMQCKIFVISITFQSGQLVLDIHSVEMWWRNDKHMTRVFILKYQIKIRFQSFSTITLLFRQTYMKALSTKVFFRKMIIEKIVSFCRWIAGVMWRRDVGTVSILDCDENLPTLPTLATNREESYTISSPDDDYFFNEMIFDEIIISE